MVDFSSIGSFAGTGGVGGTFGLVGAGLSIAGGLEASAAQQKSYQLQQQELGTQSAINALRQDYMHMSNRRMQLQQVRQGQVARSMALTKSAGSGSQFSSSLAGAYGNIAGQTNTNIGSLAQSTMFGDQMFGLEATLTGQKQQQLGFQSAAASDQGLASIGGGLSSLGGSKFLGG